jgi:hypothetical protein
MCMGHLKNTCGSASFPFPGDPPHPHPPTISGLRGGVALPLWRARGTHRGQGGTTHGVTDTAHTHMSAYTCYPSERPPFS